MGGIFRLAVEQRVEHLDRFGRAVLPVEHGREVGARGGEGRRQLERPAEQVLRIPVAAEPRRQLGHHPDGGDVGRLLLEVGAEQPLGDGEPALDQGQAGLHQPRVADRGGERFVDVRDRCFAGHGPAIEEGGGGRRVPAARKVRRGLCAAPGQGR